MISEPRSVHRSREGAGVPLFARCLALLGLVFLAIGLGTLAYGDWARYYACATTALVQGGAPYACPHYYNMPTALLVMSPFGALGPALGGWAWALGATGSAGLALLLLLRLFQLLEDRSAGLVAALALCPFTLFLLAYQQLSAVVFLIEVATLWLLIQERYRVAALLLPLAVVKPQLLLVLLPLLAVLPRRYRIVSLGLAAGAGILSVGLFAEPFLRAVISAWNTPRSEHATIALRELIVYFSDAGGWRLVGYGLLVPPFAYCAYQTYQLGRARHLDLVILAKLLPAGLLWLPYNRAYDWVLAIPAYLVLWDLADRRWTRVVWANIGVTLLAYPVSTATFFAHSPLSVNPVPLLLLVYSVERLAAAHPDRVARLRRLAAGLAVPPLQATGDTHAGPASLAGRGGVRGPGEQLDRR